MPDTLVHSAKAPGSLRFFVTRSPGRRGADRQCLGPYPSSDIAMVIAEHLTFVAVERGISGFLADVFAERLVHARHYFGSRIGRWMEHDMPSRERLPSDPELALIDPRILARNGHALAQYLAAGPGAVCNPLYDHLIRRYLHTICGFDPGAGPDDVRELLEPLHYGVAVRQLVRRCAQGESGFRRYQVTQSGDGHSHPRLDRDQGARMLREQARYYWGFDASLAGNNFTPRVRGKWERFCSGAVILPGIDRHELFAAGRDMLDAAAIAHGVDATDNGIALRWMLLHLSQWYLASARGLL